MYHSNPILYACSKNGVHRVCLFFLIFDLNIDYGYSLEPIISVLSKKYTYIYQNVFSENFHFYNQKCPGELPGHVFVISSCSMRYAGGLVFDDELLLFSFV